MAGRKKRYFHDRIRLLAYSILGLSVLLFYVFIYQNPSNFFLFLYFVGGTVIFFKRKAIYRWFSHTSLGIRVLGLKRYPIRILSAIPRVIWGASAIFGIFLFGVIAGSATSANSTHTPTDTKRELEYRQVIDGYQDISRLFYLQQQDMDIVTDSSIWQDHPEELTDAIASYHQKKNEILFQFGRIYELRRSAGLSDDKYLKVD